MPPIKLKRVVFPEPLGPLMTVALPASSESVTPRIAASAPEYSGSGMFSSRHRVRSSRPLPHGRVGVGDGRPPGRNDCCHGIRDDGQEK